MSKTKKDTLSDRLAELANPTPQFVDPEDEYNEETKARVDHYDEEYDMVQKKSSKNKTNLRQKNAELLAASDCRYAGKKISRKDLEGESVGDADFGEGSEDEDSLEGDSIFDNQESKVSESEKSEDEDLQQFRKNFKQKSGWSVTIMKENSKSKVQLESDDANDVNDYDSENDEMGSEEDDYEEGDEEEEEEGEEDDSNSEGEENDSSQKKNVEGDVEKGKSVQSQLSLWDHLLECRIKIHKGIHLANCLPRGEGNFGVFLNSGNQFPSAVQETEKTVKSLMDSLLELQNLVLKSNPQTRSLLKRKPHEKADESDEEIPSDTDDEQDEDQESGAPQRKKLKVEEYENQVQGNLDNHRQFFHRTLQIWNEKTRLASGRAGSSAKSGFGAFEQSILKQIDIILSDKQRLINRTRIKRSAYRILGAVPGLSNDNTERPETGSQDDLPSENVKGQEDEFDAEIYDDDDFYHQLLRELIERRTVEGGSDQIAVGRQWLEIQKIRAKAKRKVDPKASKGRRLRYQVHQKLVSFMAPHPEGTWNDLSKNELFGSLFKSLTAN